MLVPGAIKPAPGFLPVVELLIFALILLAGSLFYFLLRAERRLEEVDKAWRAREEQWRTHQREIEEAGRREVRDLLDRYLVKQHVEPLQIHNKKAIVIDNDPTPDLSPIDVAIRQDEVLEELEQLHPEVRGLHYEDARRMYKDEWWVIEKALENERKPFFE